MCGYWLFKIVAQDKRISTTVVHPDLPEGAFGMDLASSLVPGLIVICCWPVTLVTIVMICFVHVLFTILRMRVESSCVFASIIVLLGFVVLLGAVALWLLDDSVNEAHHVHDLDFEN